MFAVLYSQLNYMNTNSLKKTICFQKEPPSLFFAFLALFFY
ncbi:hypothetical protein FEM08_29130 [Flavobacterium gilvum]|nr:hypothetical protein FEM08_29130 [Flavobacterium gilvum]